METKEKAPEAEANSKDFKQDKDTKDFDIIKGIKKEFSQSTEQSTGFFRVRTANQCIEDAKTQSEPRNLYNGLIYENEITFLFADAGIGKSTFAVQIADEISKTDKVLYFDLELSDKQFQKRYSDDYKNEHVFNENFIRVDFSRPFIIPDKVSYDAYFIDCLKSVIDSTGAKIVIIDNMTKIISGDTDTARATKPLMDLLCDLKFENNLTLLLLEHTRKTDNSRPISLNDLQGSKMKSNFADSAFSIGRSARDKNFRYIKQHKNRSTETEFDAENVLVYEVVKEQSFLQFKFVECDTEYNHLKQPSEEDKNDLIKKVKEFSQQGITQRDIAQKLGIAVGTVNNYLKK